MEAMNLSSKCFGSSKQVTYDEGIDRISGLPDKILGHILSYLPTKHAVGTSILSRRWLNLYTLITNFDFDEKLTFRPKSSGADFELLKVRMDLRKCPGMEDVKWSSTFKDFVDRVLMLCKPTNISKFRLKCDLGFDCSNVNAWIRFALLRRVTELDIFTYAYESNVLPQSLFVCETLVVLKLRGKFEMKFPSSFLLPVLKYLQLHSVTFSEEYCSLNRLISGCPVLEELVLGGDWQYVETINIFSPGVKRLTMDFSDIFMSCQHRTDVVLDLPNLLHYHYVDYLAENYCIKNLNSLEDARIDILLDLENTDWGIFCDSILGLMYGVSSAKHLYFSGKCMEALSGKFKLPTFVNLSCLEIGWSRCIQWREFLPDFLHSSPMLENLVLSEGLIFRKSDDDYDDKNFWSRLRKTPHCLSHNLKSITMEPFHGFDEELSIAKYLLRHGKVLIKLKLLWRISCKKEYQDLMKLLKIGRLASKECVIDLTEY